MEKEDLIVHLLRENRVDIKEVKDDISEMKVDVALNRQDLQEHMAQTKMIKEMSIDNKNHLDKRIELIEHKLTATYLLKLVIAFASGVGIVTGAIYGIIRIYSSVT